MGVPRKYYQPGQTSFRCACIKESDKNLANIQEYENCPPHENSCLVNIRLVIYFLQINNKI